MDAITVAGSAVSSLVLLVIGAACLRAAIAIYNRLVGGAGSPRAVPSPSQEKAMGVLLVTALLNAMVTFLIGLVRRGGIKAAAASILADDPAGLLVSLATGLPVLVGTLTVALPTRLTRALLVVLVHLMIAVAIAIALVAVLVVISLLPQRW